MRWHRVIAIVFLLAYFAVFLFLPVFTVIAEGVRADYLVEVFRTPVYRQGLVNSFLIAITVTFIVMLMSLPLAFIADRFDFAGKRFINAMIFVPLILPPFVGALGFAQIFGKFGAFNCLLERVGLYAPGAAPDWLGNGGFFVVCLIEALHLYPILYLNTTTALANVDPALHEAAENLGCDGWTKFRRITLPLIRPGIFAGGIIVFIWSFTELGTPLMLGFDRVTAVQIFNGVTELGTNPLPYALVFVLLVVSAGLYILSRMLFGQTGHAMTSKGITSTRARPLPGLLGWAAFGVFLMLTLLAALPHLGVTLLSVSGDWYRSILPSALTASHYRSALSHAFVVPSIINSLYYAGFAMVAAVVVGILVALLTERWKPYGWQAFDVLAMLPLAIPGIILAFGYLSMATRYDILRRFLDPVENPTMLLIIAYGMRRLPYVARAAVAGLQQTPVDLEHAAANLGAGSWTTLRRIVVPLIMANLIAGALFAFSFSMLEVSDSLILAQKAQYFPITRAIYELAAILGSGPYIACAFGVWAMVFLATTILVATALLGRTMGQMFRF